MPSPKLRSRTRRPHDRPWLVDEPCLVDVYRDFAGTGDDVHAEYGRRWAEWHRSVCGRDACRVHRPRTSPRGDEAA